MASLKTNETKKRLIIKISHPHGSSKKPILTSYWVDENYVVNKTNACSATKTPIVKENSKGDSRSTLKNIDGETKLMKKKKPMEHYKKMQCWVILKRVLVGRDGWALKEPFNLKVLKGLEKKSKSRVIGLKDIEAKLGLYSTPDEFANDMRLLFSHALMVYPSKNEIHRIAMRLSDTFEYKWKTLKEEWVREERKRSKIHKRKRESHCARD